MTQQKLDENTVLWLKKWAGILEEGDGRGMGRYITVYSREDLPDGKTHRKTLQLTKRRYNGMFNEDEQATLDAGETVERHIKNNNGNLVRIRYATGTGTSADLYNEAYNRSPKTKQEKSKNAANDEKEPKPRAKRAAKNLPSTYDDLPKDRSRSWKKHRKSQYKNPGKLAEDEVLFLKKWAGILEEDTLEEAIPASTYYKLVRKSDHEIVDQGSKAKMRKLQKEKGADDYYVGQSPSKKVGDKFKTS